MSGGGDPVHPNPTPPESETKQRSRSSSGANAPSPPPPVIVVGHPEVTEQETDPQELLMMFDEVQEERLGGEITPTDSGADSDTTKVPVVAESSDQPIFFK